MPKVPGADKDDGADKQATSRSRDALAPPLQIPKNRSTGNLVAHHEFDGITEDGGHERDYTSLVRSPILMDHDHGFGLSGLRKIRQQIPLRAPSVSSATPQQPFLSPSVNIPRSASMIAFPMHLPSGPSSPNFVEDLHRFPTESLHSFSFAHQSEEFIHSRQNLLKRSVDFMKARRNMVLSPAAAAMASAEARVAGDAEAQNMFDLISKARLVGRSQSPSEINLRGPLTGPAQLTGENVFEREFVRRTASPDTLSVSDTTVKVANSSTNQKKPAQNDSGPSTRTPTNESGATDVTSPPGSTTNLKRTLTDTDSVSVQQKLMDAMSQPYMAQNTDHLISTNIPPSVSSSFGVPRPIVPVDRSSATHGHTTRWVPAAQAIFTTQARPPWTIIAANDLACLVFGVTKAEVCKIGILEVVQEERRRWLERKLLRKGDEEDASVAPSMSPKLQLVNDMTPVSQGPTISHPQPNKSSSAFLGARGGITAQLLSKPNSRSQTPSLPSLNTAAGRRAQTVHGTDSSLSKSRANKHHHHSPSGGVLLCGDVIPIQKRNGATGSASVWVKEKKIGLIWVLEEIHEDAAYVTLGEDGIVTEISGEAGTIWGHPDMLEGMDIGMLIPHIPRQGIDPRFGEIDFAETTRRKYFTCRHCDKINIPATVEQVRGSSQLRVSSFPHIAGIMVVSPRTLRVQKANAIFSGALFGWENPDSLPITRLLPEFDKILDILTEENNLELVEGIVIPEHSFRKASALLSIREGRPEGAMAFLHPEGLKARHHDGTDLRIDVQMRVVCSEKQGQQPGSKQKGVFEVVDESDSDTGQELAWPELVYALWITYSRHLHATRAKLGISSPLVSGTVTPLCQPSPGQTPARTPPELTDRDGGRHRSLSVNISATKLTQQLRSVASSAVAAFTGVGPGKPPEILEPAASPQPTPEKASKVTGAVQSVQALRKETSLVPSPEKKKKSKKIIDDFVILEEMGQGAYGQVKLAKYRNDSSSKVVLKFVTKRRILVDTWTRDRRLGTVPLEIHVLDFLSRDEYRHPNIVEMADFFEDETNYYIEMIPHGLPGMDLFDYIEMKVNMDKDEARSIFVQCAKALHHLHTKALVVHRDIKDENVILDGEGNIKLIDFGSAAYIKNGPFNVFVGTIDYAAPEVLSGTKYDGRAQDVWALGILLYTIIYKENPFYSVDEIMDRDLRIPWKMDEDSVDLIRHMLVRSVDQRYTITQVLEHPFCQDLGKKE